MITNPLKSYVSTWKCYIMSRCATIKKQNSHCSFENALLKRDMRRRASKQNREGTALVGSAYSPLPFSILLWCIVLEVWQMFELRGTPGSFGAKQTPRWKRDYISIIHLFFVEVLLTKEPFRVRNNLSCLFSPSHQFFVFWPCRVHFIHFFSP